MLAISLSAADASPSPLTGSAHAPPIKGNGADCASQSEKPLSRPLRLAMLAAHPPPFGRRKEDDDMIASIWTRGLVTVSVFASLLIAPSSNTRAGHVVTLRDFLTLHGKPLDVQMMPLSRKATVSQQKSEWVPIIKENMVGAKASIPMEDGGVLDVTIADVRPNISLQDVEVGKDFLHHRLVYLHPSKEGTWIAAMNYRLRDGKGTWTIRQLPDTTILVTRWSKRLYGDRFRLVVALPNPHAVQKDGTRFPCLRLHFIEPPDAETKDAVSSNESAARAEGGGKGKKKGKEVATTDAPKTTFNYGADSFQFVFQADGKTYARGSVAIKNGRGTDQLPGAVFVVGIEKGMEAGGKRFAYRDIFVIDAAGQISLALPGTVITIPTEVEMFGHAFKPQRFVVSKDSKFPADPSELVTTKTRPEKSTNAPVSKDATVEPEVTFHKKAEKIFPAFTDELQGQNPVRVRNPNEFAVAAGVRSGKKGKNLDIPANGVETVYIPDGKYDIYFVYSNKPEALFQGDSFTLNDNGVEIQIVKVVNGNYSIRQVK